jgi:hypothetical protein
MARNETKIEITAEDRTAPAFTSLSNRLLGVEQGFGKITGLIGGLSAATAVGFLAQSVTSTAELADGMGDLAQTLGTTTENLSKLKYAADIEGVFEPLQSGMTKLAKASEDFRSGSAGAIDSFGKLKIDPSSFNDTAELFTAVADKLSKMEDGARKTAIAQELLGKSGAQLLPLINQGADGLKQYADEAERFGLVISDEVAEAAGKLNDNFAKIEAAAKGMSVQLGGPLVESLSKTTEGMIESVAQGNKLFALFQGFAGLGKLPFDFFFSSDSSVNSKSRVKELEQDVIDLEQGILKLKKTGGGKANELAVGGSLEDLQKKLSVTKNQLEAFKKFGEQLDAKPAAKVEEKFTPEVIKSSSKSKSTGKSDAEKYAEDMAKLIKAFDDSVQPTQTVSEKLQDQLDAYTKIDPAVKAYAESLIAQSKAQEDAIASAERNNEMMASLQAYDDGDQSLYKANSETYDAILREAEDLNASLIENDKERARKQLEIENRRRLERIDLMEGEADQIAAIRDAELERQDAAFKALEKQTSQSSNIGKDLGLTFSSAFEDSIVKGNELRDVVDGLGKDLIRVFTRKKVTEPFAEAFDGFSSGIGDWFKSIIPNANGGVYNSPSLSAFSGSVVSSPTMFAFANGAGLMGEAGAEGIFPLKRGKDGKLGVEASGAGAGNVEYNVQVSVDATGGSVQGNNEKANDLGRQIESAVRAVLLNEKRQGGMLA